MSKSLTVGVLLCTGGVQLLDLAAVDLFGMLSTTYLRSCGFPETVVAMGHDVKFHYIADEGEGPKESITTSDVAVRITDTLDSVGELDILVIPGPTPTYLPSKRTIEFIQKQTTILTICSGILPVAFSGILSHKRATAPLGLLPTLRERVPDVEWISKRWTTDDDERKKIWTSGAVTNGTDMVAAYLRENFDEGLVKLVCGLADVAERGQEYQDWQLNAKFF